MIEGVSLMSKPVVIKTEYLMQPVDLSPVACKGVFLVTTTNAFVSFERDLSINTDLWISTVPRGRERSEWASLWTERVSESRVAKQSAVQGVTEVSGVNEWT